MSVWLFNALCSWGGLSAWPDCVQWGGEVKASGPHSPSPCGGTSELAILSGDSGRLIFHLGI